MHDISELTLGTNAPAHWNEETHSEAEDCELTDDQCVIDGRDFFIRGCLDIPIRGTEQSFRWGVWTTLSEENFCKISEHWDDPQRIELGPHFGWLSTPLPGYPDTINLKCRVHHQAPGIRPMIEVMECDHPLAMHYRDGIPADELLAIIHPYLE